MSYSSSPESVAARDVPQASRRQFLATSAVLATSTYGLTGPAARGDQPVAKNDRVPIGLIGAGGMGVGNMWAAKKWVDVVAIADVDAGRRDAANRSLSQGRAEVYEDYRSILDRDDIQVLHIATPDHWHTKPLVEALLAGKDVYCEKPLTLTIDEGKLIRQIQARTGRIVQVGTQQRSTFALFVKAVAMVHQGRVGKIRRIECGIGEGLVSPPIPVAQVPTQLNWERWLGPAPAVDYRLLKKEGITYSNSHAEFRWWYAFSGGKLTDWGAHHVDIAVWALSHNGDRPQGPVSISGQATHPVEFKDGLPARDDRYNTATKFEFTVTYPDEVQIVIRSGGRNGVLIEGELGRLFVSREQLVGAPVEDLAENPLPADAIANVYKHLPIQFNEREAHWYNFLHCVRERSEPISDVRSHLEGLNLCHLTGIVARLGRSVQWDPTQEQILGDEQANRMLARPYRKGYEIELG
jgi:predicted dehydrogenase